MNHIERRKTKQIRAGTLLIGGDAPISVQSMTNAPPHDFEKCRAQVAALFAAGCGLVRLTVPDPEAARVFGKLRETAAGPLCADIHFDYKMAIEAVAAGADKLRINPGNIGGEDRVKAVAAACGAKNVPIRIGVNAGSLEKSILEKHGKATAEAMVESALFHVKQLEKFDFTDICISLKASDAARTLRANLLASERFDYPLHIGVTESGRGEAGLLKSAAGIGGLLAMGIGDTVRVSLTGDPVREVEAGFAVLKAAGRAERGIDVVSCPTCGRCAVDLEAVADRLERELEGVKTDRKITVAVMGCAVNGPGEAKEADIGVVAGKDGFLLFVGGETVGRIGADEAVPRLLPNIERLIHRG